MSNLSMKFGGLTNGCWWIGSEYEKAELTFECHHWVNDNLPDQMLRHLSFLGNEIRKDIPFPSLLEYTDDYSLLSVLQTVLFWLKCIV